MTVDGTDLTASVDRRTVRSVSKILLAAGALVFVLYLVSLLPGIDRLVPLTPVSFAALVGAIATVALVALLLAAAPRLASLTRGTLEGPQAVVENVAAVVYWVVVLAAVLVAHRGLYGAVAPLLEDLVWLYDVAFLLVALPVVAVVAARLYATIDPGADLIATRVADDGTAGSDRGSADGTEPARSDDT